MTVERCTYEKTTTQKPQTFHLPPKSYRGFDNNPVMAKNHYSTVTVCTTEGIISIVLYTLYFALCLLEKLQAAEVRFEPNFLVSVNLTATSPLVIGQGYGAHWNPCSCGHCVEIRRQQAKFKMLIMRWVGLTLIELLSHNSNVCNTVCSHVGILGVEALVKNQDFRNLLKEQGEWINPEINKYQLIQILLRTTTPIGCSIIELTGAMPHQVTSWDRAQLVHQKGRQSHHPLPPPPSLDCPWCPHRCLPLPTWS